jgi:hypothetical protein
MKHHIVVSSGCRGDEPHYESQQEWKTHASQTSEKAMEWYMVEVIARSHNRSSN